jgi:hypothetical protein
MWRHLGFKKASAFVFVDFFYGSIFLSIYYISRDGVERDIGDRDVLGTRAEGIIRKSGLEMAGSMLFE